MRRLGIPILYITLFLTLFVLFAHLATHRPAMEFFLFAVALAVGLTPELLSMVVTVHSRKGAVRYVASRNEPSLSAANRRGLRSPCADRPRDENTFFSFKQDILRSSDWQRHRNGPR